MHSAALDTMDTICIAFNDGLRRAFSPERDYSRHKLTFSGKDAGRSFRKDDLSLLEAELP